MNYLDVVQNVTIRKYEVDTDGLCRLLRQQKQKLKLSNKKIASTIGVSVTNVEHWFRQDKCFSIPDSDIWFDLKELLKIKTDEFDESIMTFIEKPGVFEKGMRLYLVNKVAPTITTGNETRIIIDG